MDKVVQALIYSFLIYVIFVATIGPMAMGLLLSAAIIGAQTPIRSDED